MQIYSNFLYWFFSLSPHHIITYSSGTLKNSIKSTIRNKNNHHCWNKLFNYFVAKNSFILFYLFKKKNFQSNSKHFKFMFCILFLNVQNNDIFIKCQAICQEKVHDFYFYNIIYNKMTAQEIHIHLNDNNLK